MLQRAGDIIHADRRIRNRQMAVQLSFSNGSAMAIIYALRASPGRRPECRPEHVDENFVN
jgi:hypothetical protein